MLKKEERSLNLRGQIRQLGSRTVNYINTQGKQNLIIIGVAIILFMIFFVLNPGMADKYNILSMVQSLAPYAILAIGVTFVIATGGIDLSIGTVLIASASVAGSIVMKSNGLLWLAIPLMIAIGTMFGAFNGFMVAKLKLPPFIATLGTMMFARGVSAIIAVVPNVFFPTNLESDWYRSIFSNFHNFPISLVWVFALMFICMFIMNKTKVGRYILAIGSNEEAARLSGIKTDNYKIIAYTIAGLFAGIAAIFWTAAQQSQQRQEMEWSLTQSPEFILAEQARLAELHLFQVQLLVQSFWLLFVKD
ncbi:MAG: ABC transporter permease [Clostridia bacterium]